MTEQSAFSKKNIENSVIPPRHDLLDELHLPPQVVSFLRENAKTLQIIGIVLAVVVLAWIFYDQYSAKQRQVAAAAFAAALNIPEQSERVQAIRNVIDEYGGTQTALWGMLELGHIAFRDGDYQQAISRYNEVLDDVDDDNPVVPLLRMSIAQSLEFTEEYDKALSIYASLAKEPGFAAEAYPAMGRIYEMQGNTAKAVTMYEKYLALSGDEPSPFGNGDSASSRRLIEDKLAALQDAAPGTEE